MIEQLPASCKHQKQEHNGVFFRINPDPPECLSQQDEEHNGHEGIDKPQMKVPAKIRIHIVVRSPVRHLHLGRKCMPEKRVAQKLDNIKRHTKDGNPVPAFHPCHPAVLKRKIKQAVHGNVNPARIQIPSCQGYPFHRPDNDEKVPNHGRQKGIQEIRHLRCDVLL